MALRDQPYIPLYVQDIMTDEKLNECSASTHGIYIKGIMCLMHKSETYGKILLKQTSKLTGNIYLDFGNQLIKHLPYTAEEIAMAIEQLLNEKVCYFDGDYLCQKRMIRDNEISEVRSIAGKKGGGNPNFVKTKSQTNSEYESEYENGIESVIKSKNKKGDIQGEGKEPKYSGMFESFWLIYPKKLGKGDAYKAWKKLDPSANLIEKMINAVKVQSQSIQWQKESGQYIPNCSTWINQARWDDELPIDTGESELSKKNRRAIEEFERRYENK